MSTSRKLTPGRIAPPRRRAFTLLEMIIAMAVFSIVSASIFGVVQVSMQATADVEEAQRVSQQVNAFTELCRKSLAALPPQAELRMVPAEENEENGQELVLRNTPLSFALGAGALNYGSTTLGLRQQKDGLYSLAISRSDFMPPEGESMEVRGATSESDAEDVAFEPDEQGRYWLVLIPDLAWASWRFYDPAVSDWVESWTKKTRPRLIELQLFIPDDAFPIRAVFPVSPAQTTANK